MPENKIENGNDLTCPSSPGTIWPQPYSPLVSQFFANFQLPYKLATLTKLLYCHGLLLQTYLHQSHVTMQTVKAELLDDMWR